MNGYQELKDIYRLVNLAVVEFDKGEYSNIAFAFVFRALIARIREIAGTYPKYGNDNLHAEEAKTNE